MKAEKHNAKRVCHLGLKELSFCGKRLGITRFYTLCDLAGYYSNRNFCGVIL